MIVNIILVLSGLWGCFADSGRIQYWSTNSSSHVDQSTSGTDPRLFSELRRRSAALVDTAAIPSNGCFLNHCNNPQPPGFFHGVLIPQCHLVPVPCRPGQDSTECYSWDLDCFCNAPVPLSCASWCGWGKWFQVEDWFAQACPNTPPVDFSTLPTCAQECISQGSFNYGCITGDRSCFCLDEDLFNCPAQCPDPADVQRITDWYQQTCEYSSQDTASIVSAGKSTQTSASAGQRTGAAIQTAQPTKLHWYEILIIITAGCTVAAAVVCTVVLCVLKRAPRFQKRHALTPDPSMEDTGGLGVSEVEEVEDWTQPKA